jgi:hypothetical protein
MVRMAMTLKVLMAKLPPAKCSAVTSYDHKAGDNVKDDPEGSEGKSLGNI